MDFIFGSATALFEDCEIIARGRATSPRNPENEKTAWFAVSFHRAGRESWRSGSMVEAIDRSGSGGVCSLEL